jgi:hypothetical protein
VYAIHFSSSPYFQVFKAKKLIAQEGPSRKAWSHQAKMGKTTSRDVEKALASSQLFGHISLAVLCYKYSQAMGSFQRQLDDNYMII